MEATFRRRLAASCLVVPSHVEDRCAARGFPPDINTGKAINPTSLKLGDRIISHFVENNHEEQELVVPIDRVKSKIRYFTTPE